MSPKLSFIPSHDVIQRTIASGLSFLASQQLPDGEFQTLIGRDSSLTDATFDSSPFVTAIVCHALQQVGPAAGPSIDRALTFLEREMELGAVWRYYSSKNFKHLRVPPDLDDTACASMALRFRKRLANRALILGTRDATGRFGTWMVRTPSVGIAGRTVLTIGDLVGRWKTPPPPQGLARDPRFATATDEVSADEIDPVVNANVVAYLGDGPDTASATRYLRATATNGLTEPSYYYPNPLSLAYALARAIESGVGSLNEIASAVVAAIDARLDVNEGDMTPLTAGLGVAAHCSLMKPTPGIERAAQFILKSQQTDGGWRREVFYNGPKEFWGSEELTTAICLEALARYERRI